MAKTPTMLWINDWQMPICWQRTQQRHLCMTVTHTRAEREANKVRRNAAVQRILFHAHAGKTHSFMFTERTCMPTGNVL